jgi:hypothetical protein
MRVASCFLFSFIIFSSSKVFSISATVRVQYIIS